jgi:predicted outer membrane repeat protein
MRKQFMCIILFVLMIGAYATTIYIPEDYSTIQAGIDASEDGDVIIASDRTYVENINFTGKAITVASLFYTTRDTSYISHTFINGSQSGTVVTFENGEDSTSVLIGFTIKNGLALRGGGIGCWNNSSPRLEHLIVTDNSVYLRGGGIYCQTESSPSLENVTISDNSADWTGGGFRCQYYSTPSLKNVIITGNSAGSGGGISCSYHSAPSLENVTIMGNSAEINGGGISSSMSSPSLLNVTITNNSAGSDGGGFSCYASSPTLENVTIAGNSAGENGGGINCKDNVNLSLVNCVLWDNLPQEVYFSSSGNSNMATIGYSDIAGGFDGIITNNHCTVNWLAGNIDVDPIFMDALVGDCHLAEDSPCIDAGIAYLIYAGEILVDLSEDEYYRAAPDMGAYESNFTKIIYIPEDYATIQEGIDASEQGDEIIVAPGTYVENINFDGKAVILGSWFHTTQDASYISQTIIDGNQEGSVVSFENEEDSTSVLTGFTITNGQAFAGGGIYCLYSSPSLENLTITDNSAVRNGGGIFCNDSSPGLENVTITDNSAEFYGGGIFCSDNSSPDLENVTIADNSAERNGGGIYCSDYSSLGLENVTITDNSADLGGGIYYLDNCSSSLMNCILWNNSPREIEFANYENPNTITIAYSDIDGGEDGIQTSNNGTVNWLDGNIDADPIFLEAEIRDYHLTVGSPCIDAGIAYYEYEGEVLVDISEDQYFCNAPDMGAYESPYISFHNNNEIEPVKDNVTIYPNPFNPETNILFELATGSNVLIEIFNIKGQKVTTLVNEHLNTGSHKVTWNAENYGSGIYLLRFNNTKKSEIKKLILLK